MPMPTSGRWPVVLSGRAIRELRLLSEDKRTLEIVRTKLKELSSGQFTIDNHSPVRGSCEHIPVYRARLSNDLRIIYVIDLVVDDRSYEKYDHQVIKVFSVSSRARIYYDFWVKVSKYLARQGPEYRNRCIYREAMDGPNSSIVPARFAHLGYASAIVNPELAMDAETDMHELHETIVLEKFAPVNKSLYNSILADMEAVLPMALNSDEKAIVRHNGTSVVVGRSGTGKTTALIYKMRANAQLGARSETSPQIRQLFVTRSKVLTQHIASNYHGLVESSEIAFKSTAELEELRKANQKYQNRELVEFDNEVDLRDDLPRRFSQLTEANFPLFVSFDKLCDLLEADIEAQKGLTLASTGMRRPRLITFSDFKHRYWPTFDYKLTRNLDPALVYSEILGVIKGGDKILDMEEYVSRLSHKKSPLLANVRPQVYAIFEAYTKKSGRNNEIDAADRTREILTYYKSNMINLGHQVDYLFVDEVQDHLMADVHLLQSLCSNMDGGYWCGDTAQTINIGSSFRIKDLKAYIYESMVPPQDASHRQRKIPAPFSTFELTVNFRSHGGIVKYAASLVELIYTLFPSSIDHMQPESAKTPGRAPVLFTSPADDEALFVSYLLDNKLPHQATPFGAQQAIIVRSQSTAKSLTGRLQKRCTVLNLRDTKGLEFDDLFLYNFFAESEAPTSAWRVILGLSVHNENGRVKYQMGGAPVSVSPILCSELKQLYVAVTRARHRCWLWDSGTTIDLMGDFWERLNLITRSGSLEILRTFAAASNDLRLWAQRGQEFFSNGLYALAVTCFERAEQDKEAAIADAYQHMSEAKTFPDDCPDSKNAFIKAAERMKACAVSSDREGMFHSSLTLWYHAATCFETAKEVSQASQSYCKAGFYDQAALVCFEAQDMDGCLAVLLSYGTRLDTSLATKIREACSTYYLRERKYSQLIKLFDGNLDRCVELARSLKFRPQLKDLLRMNRQFKELADAHLEDGSPTEAIRCLRQNFNDDSTIQQSRKIVSNYLWANFGLDTNHDTKCIEEASEVINISRSPMLPGGLVEYSERHDLGLFDAILSRATTSLDLFQNIFHDLDHANEEDQARIVLIQHHVLRATDWITGDSYHTFSSHLREWHEYATSIERLGTLSDPCQHPTVRRLLGISDLVSSAAGATRTIHIPNGFFLQASSVAIRADAQGGEKCPGGGISVTPGTADQRIRAFFVEHIKKQLLNHHPALFRSPWTQINSPWKHNVSVALEKHSEATFHTGPSIEELIRSLSLVFLTLNPVKGSNTGGTTKGNRQGNNIQISWITRLFNVIFPETGAIRSIYKTLALFDPPNVIRTWVSESLELLDPTKHKHKFATLLVICLALASELDPDHEPVKTTLSVQLKNGPLGRADQFTGDLCILFQRDSSLKFSKVIDAIERLAGSKSSIDLFALVHLTEQVAREVILSVRASAGASKLTLRGGFSGLIMPLSWAASLAVQVKEVRVVQLPCLNKLLSSIKTILQRLSNGLPDPREIISHEWQNHTAESLVIRLLWTVCFVVINLRPRHPSLPVALDVMKSAITEETYSPNSLAGDLGGIDIDHKIFTEITSQQSCLSILSQTFQHEDIVMLSDGCKHILLPRRHSVSLAKQHLVHRVIPFKDLNNLRTTLGVLAESFVAPREGSPFEDKRAEFQETRPNLTLKEAVLRLQAARSRRMRRQRPLSQRVSELPGFVEGQLHKLYDVHSEGFLILGRKAWERTRDRISWRLVRGPCLYIILALQMLVDEMDQCIEQLDQDIQTPGLDSNRLTEIQLKTAKVREQQAKLNDWAPRDAAPKLLEAGNLIGVKTQTENA